MRPVVTMREALSSPDILGNALKGKSWATWRVCLLALCGEKLTVAEREIFRTIAGGRQHEPGQLIELFAAVVGRRGGKSRAISVLVSYLAGCIEWDDVLVPGETALAAVLAPDGKQGAVILNYTKALFERSPMLSRLVERPTDGGLLLKSGIEITVRWANYRRIRGPTLICAILDESAFLYDADSGSLNSDADIVQAVTPALATTGGPLVLISSPHAKRGELFLAHKRYFGKDDPHNLVVQGASRDFNPSLKQSVVDRAMDRDPEAAKAEYLGQFRSDVSALLEREIIEQCVEKGVYERPHAIRIQYSAFVDPSGGSSDSMTLAIGHKERNIAVLDAVREIRPPFSPEDVTEEFAALLRSYGIARVTGDRYAGEWVREQFSKRGIGYEPSARSKSDIYRDFVPLVNAKRAALLDHQRLITQLSDLERRTSRGGRDSIDHSPGAKDDVANSVAGVLTSLVVKKYNYDTTLSWVSNALGSHPDYKSVKEWAEANIH